MSRLCGEKALLSRDYFVILMVKTSWFFEDEHDDYKDEPLLSFAI